MAPLGKSLSLSLDEMLRSLQLSQHRGPDAQQLAALFSDASSKLLPLTVWQSQVEKNLNLPVNAYLGHARLKIRDTSDGANQPFFYQAPNGKTYWLLYNGEIYNDLELRADLKARGYEFNTQSDTELIPALFDCYTSANLSAMLNRLNGMFSFALLDSSEQKLYLARDRYGIKPLYTTWRNDGSLAFASELKSLLALPGVLKQLDYQALYEHLTFQFTLAHRTLIESVRAFPQGHWACWDLKSKHWHQEAYWQPRFEINSKRSEAETLGQIRESLSKAVTSQCVGDVPIGGFLSGGLDSGAITTFASKHVQQYHTVTCGFEMSDVSGSERLFDEREDTRDLSEFCKTKHLEEIITSQTLPLVLDKLVWHLDDFQAGISYPNFIAAQSARNYMTVALSGVGGDELFAGYPWRYQSALGTSTTSEFHAAYYQQWVRLLSDEQKQALFSAHAFQQVNFTDTNQLFQNALQAINNESFLQTALRFDMQYFLPALLTVEDRLSMAFGLESRVPFLDNHLVDLALTIPDSYKLRFDDTSNAYIGKWGLRQALKNDLPTWVVNGRKQGFTPPDASWYRGPLLTWIENRLFSEAFLETGIFQPDLLKQLWQEHQSGEKNHRFLIWSLLCLESWLRQFA